MVLLAAEQAGEVAVIAEQAWPWARHYYHRRVTVAFILASAEQVLLEPRLVEAKYPGCTSNRCLP